MRILRTGRGVLKLTDQQYMALAEGRERLFLAQAEESRRQERDRARGEKVAAEINKKHLGIDRSRLMNCCGALPSSGVRLGVPFVYCHWCGRRVENAFPKTTVIKWNKSVKSGLFEKPKQ